MGNEKGLVQLKAWGMFPVTGPSVPITGSTYSPPFPLQELILIAYLSVMLHEFKAHRPAGASKHPFRAKKVTDRGNSQGNYFPVTERRSFRNIKKLQLQRKDFCSISITVIF